MARWTQSDEENAHLHRIIEQATDHITSTKTTVVLKDGSRLVGKILPSAIGNNRGQDGPERGWATVKFSDENGERELDALDIAEIFENPN
jgi:hypothetical protein